MLRYLATALIVFVATPINKQPDEIKPTGTVVAHQVQLVEEIDEPQVSKNEVVQTTQPPQQDKPKVTGCEAVRSEVSKYGDWDIDTMVAISKAESGCRSNARGDGHLTFTKNSRTYGYSLGFFQVRILPGRERCDTYDVQVNVRCAHDIFKAQGYRAWTVYNKGLYKKHL